VGNLQNETSVSICVESNLIPGAGQKDKNVTDVKKEISVVLLDHTLEVITGLIYATVLLCIAVLTREKYWFCQGVCKRSYD